LAKQQYFEICNYFINNIDLKIFNQTQKKEVGMGLNQQLNNDFQINENNPFLPENQVFNFARL